MTSPIQKVFYSNKKHLKLYTEMTWHNSLTILFAEVSKFLSSLDLALETNFQNKAKMLVYVKKYKLPYCLILDSETYQGLLLDYSFLLTDGSWATNLCYYNCFWRYFSSLTLWNLSIASKKNLSYLQGWILFLTHSMI